MPVKKLGRKDQSGEGFGGSGVGISSLSSRGTPAKSTSAGSATKRVYKQMQQYKRVKKAMPKASMSERLKVINRSK